MKSFRLFLLIIATILMGCQEDAVLDEYSLQTGELKNAGGVQSMAPSASVTKTITFRSAGTLELLDPSALPFPFPFLIHASGNASHLGKFTGEYSAVMTTYGPSITGVMTAANGDEIFIESISMIAPTPEDPMEYIDYRITGGTGRFDGVTGELYSAGQVNWSVMPPTFYFNGEGYLAY